MLMPLPCRSLKVLLICLVISDTFAFVHTHRAVSRCTYNPRRYVDGGLSTSPRPALWSKISDADFDTISTPLVSTDSMRRTKRTARTPSPFGIRYSQSQSQSCLELVYGLLQDQSQPRSTLRDILSKRA